MRIRVYNVCHREKISLHLPLLVGDVDQKIDDGEIEVWNSSAHENMKTKWPIIEGAFKVLVKLIPGENVICLRHLDEILKLVLVFCFPHFKHFVRPVYIICADDDGYFQGPDGEDCSPDSALERIKLGAMLIQTFTAEKMREHGFGRLAFQLEVDSNFEPVCTLFRSKLRIEEAHSMTGNQLWTHFAKELMLSNLSDKDLCKWYCFMSFTRYCPSSSSEPPKTHTDILRHTKGHTALGGGGLALFGTGNLHTWAGRVGEIYSRFTDMRKIDRSMFMDDSAYREYYWANYATGLGASLHELGHTFDLAHTPSGIMARGFDDLHKVFIVQRSKSSPNHTSHNQSNNDHRHSNHDRSSRSSSSDKSEGHAAENMVLEHSTRRYKDICYGSPFKKPISRRNSNSSNIYIAPPPLVFKVEQGFKPLPLQETVSISVQNYDGSQTHQTITKDHSFETVTEVTLGESGQLLSKHCRRDRHPSNSSTSSSSLSHTSQSPTRIIPSMLPNSPTELCSPNIQYVDDGAHWYRSSAVLLRFHKWFNKYNKLETRKHHSLSGSRIKSWNGLRLVELRSDPEGLVFHHWEFLSETPPSEFTMKLSRVQNIPADTKTVTFLAMDDLGYIIKKKINLEDFER